MDKQILEYYTENFRDKLHDDVLGIVNENYSGGYEPPVGGIPRTDLAQGVKDSLDLADSALQSGDLPNVNFLTNGLGYKYLNDSGNYEIPPTKGTSFHAWSTASNLTNISQIPGMVVGDYVQNTGAATRTILGVSAVVGGLVKSTSTTTGLADGNLRGPAGVKGDTGDITNGFPWCTGTFADKSLVMGEMTMLTPLTTPVSGFIGTSGMISGSLFVAPQTGLYLLTCGGGALVSVQPSGGTYNLVSTIFKGSVANSFLDRLAVALNQLTVIPSVAAVARLSVGETMNYCINSQGVAQSSIMVNSVHKFAFARIA